MEDKAMGNISTLASQLNEAEAVIEDMMSSIIAEYATGGKKYLREIISHATTLYMACHFHHDREMEDDDTISKAIHLLVLSQMRLDFLLTLLRKATPKTLGLTKKDEERATALRHDIQSMLGTYLRISCKNNDLEELGDLLGSPLLARDTKTETHD
jgi:hypothetical protein